MSDNDWFSSRRTPSPAHRGVPTIPHPEEHRKYVGLAALQEGGLMFEHLPQNDQTILQLGNTLAR